MLRFLQGHSLTRMNLTAEKCEKLKQGYKESSFEIWDELLSVIKERRRSKTRVPPLSQIVGAMLAQRSGLEWPLLTSDGDDDGGGDDDDGNAIKSLLPTNTIGWGCTPELNGPGLGADNARPRIF